MTTAPSPTSWTILTKFFRFEYLSVAIIFPLIGAATTSGELTGFRLLGILGGAIAFHIYVSLLNDIADLPLDRTNPARAQYPLVSGKISLRFALFITLIQVPIAAAVIYWQGSAPWAFIAMAVALFLMTIYNLWGKVTPFPVLIDILQGIAFSTLTVFGAAIVGEITFSTWLGFALGAIWMTQMNLLGGLRDLHSDLAFGLFTTPIQFGIRPSGREEIIPTFVKYYGHTLHLLMVAGGLWIITLQRYPTTIQSVMYAICLLIGALGFFLLETMFRAAGIKYDDMLASGYRYIGSSSFGLFSTLLPLLPWWAVALIIGAFFMRQRDYSLKELLVYWRK